MQQCRYLHRSGLTCESPVDHAGRHQALLPGTARVVDWAVDDGSLCRNDGGRVLLFGPSVPDARQWREGQFNSVVPRGTGVDADSPVGLGDE